SFWLRPRSRAVQCRACLHSPGIVHRRSPEPRRRRRRRTPPPWDSSTAAPTRSPCRCPVGWHQKGDGNCSVSRAFAIYTHPHGWPACAFCALREALLRGADLRLFATPVRCTVLQIVLSMTGIVWVQHATFASPNFSLGLLVEVVWRVTLRALSPRPLRLHPSAACPRRGFLEVAWCPFVLLFESPFVPTAFLACLLFLPGLFCHGRRGTDSRRRGRGKGAEGGRMSLRLDSLWRCAPPLPPGRGRP
ncbi:unnamed protein product, partial [Prorocentrum cordatum]